MTRPAAWGRAKSAGRLRHEAGRMNGLEARFGEEVLMPLWIAGEIEHYDFEPIKLRLADKTWYTIDYFAQTKDGVMNAIEVKGRWEEDARAKWKIAAQQYPCFRFFAVTRPAGAWQAEAAFIEDREAALLYGEGKCPA